MKKSPFLFLFCLIFVFGCNNDLDLAAPTKDIPVVYGVFSKLNTDHYVRIEKAFIDEQIPAGELAENSDNFIYDDLTVNLIKDGIPIELERIDGNVDGFPRETGFFNSDPNVLYKLEDVSFAGGQTVTLSIDRGPGFETVTASTEIVDNIELTVPRPGQGDRLDVRSEPNKMTKLVFKPRSNAKIFDIFITFHYNEITSAGGITAKEVVWNFVRNQKLDESRESQNADNEGINFFNLLLQEIPVEPGVVRRFQKFSIDIVGGGQAVSDYVSLTQANTGITSSQEVPNFSNLSEGLGIFSSKFTHRLDSVDITPAGRLELVTGDLLRDLNFEN
jgi:hypothetical protein